MTLLIESQYVIAHSGSIFSRALTYSMLALMVFSPTGFVAAGITILSERTLGYGSFTTALDTSPTIPHFIARFLEYIAYGLLIGLISGVIGGAWIMIVILVDVHILSIFVEHPPVPDVHPLTPVGKILTSTSPLFVPLITGGAFFFYLHYRNAIENDFPPRDFQHVLNEEAFKSASVFTGVFLVTSLFLIAVFGNLLSVSSI